MQYQRRDKYLSVFVQTYNHEKYIAQCLESILNQKTNYDFEINIIDDCSTDQTRKVIQKFKDKYPDKINLFYEDKNLGHIRTQIVTLKGFKTLQGKYIAMMEGDDYWSDENKLQKQISFLENNPDFVGCGHTVVKIYEDSSKEPHQLNYWKERREILDIHDCIMIRTFFHMSSLVLRNVFKNNWPEFLSSEYSCDLLYTPLFAQYGKMKYFDEDMGIYRAHSGGSFSTRDSVSMHLFEIKSLIRYNRWLHYKYSGSYNSYIMHRISYLQENEGREGFRSFTFKERTGLKISFWIAIINQITFSAAEHLFINIKLVISLFGKRKSAARRDFIIYWRASKKRSKRRKKELMRLIKKSFDRSFPFLERKRRKIGQKFTKPLLKKIFST